MRRLVSCKQCQRQYDGSNLAVGDRFRCHCGEAVAVTADKSHEAAVVRCSSCGGARSKGEQACGFCGADFTIHEQDLHTVCPECMTRISDKAKFCHSCGTTIAVTGSVGESDERVCPGCEPDKPLYNRQLGERKVPFLECHVCAGMWLTADSFRAVADEARDRQLPPELTGMTADPPPAGRIEPQSGKMYRKCPDCSQWMHRKNFGSRSGVIVDICKLHGVWFDNGELVRILGWIKDGGEKLAQDIEEERSTERVDYYKQQIGRMAYGSSSPSNLDGSMLGDVVAGGGVELLGYLIKGLFR